MRPASVSEVMREGVGRLRGWLLRHAGPLALALGLLFVATEAFARVGGGQGYSGGSSGGSSGGGYSGGGGSGDGGDLIYFLFWLCLNHPVIGIPLTIGVVVVVMVAKSQGGGQRRYAAHHEAPQAGRGGGADPRRGRILQRRQAVEALKHEDPDFSEPLFVDHVQLVYARAQALRAEPAEPWLLEAFSTSALASLQAAGPVDAVEDVIFGATSLGAVSMRGGQVLVQVALETNYTELRGDKRSDLLAKETWTFRRKQGVRSPGPERMRALGCASCGSTLEMKADGTCPSCGTLRAEGASQWQVHAIQRAVERLPPPAARMSQSGVEPGTYAPTVVDPELAVASRQLLARHPGFSMGDFQERVRTVFLALQHAWSEQRWEEARPHETDALFQVHRYWMDRYRRHGLVNRLDDITVMRVEPCKIVRDAWVESITVRVQASMKDWMERLDGSGRPTGKVVGGDPKGLRTFTEYWTFVRTVGGKEPVGDGVSSCPSCGAPLDRVSQAGVCGYCDAKITTGDFDWVLSRIEQDEAYVG